ncbi:hypothetical protein ACT3SZ_14410 [Corynebacterium sp. AOP40-9SA-29]|uniref:hypothetical protein n=1 Tax=Corynebacterium sp. AOP40-9SA-29 TaxID=3457677 RepID=UPI00403469A3
MNTQTYADVAATAYPAAWRAGATNPLDGTRDPYSMAEALRADPLLNDDGTDLAKTPAPEPDAYPAHWRI